jgi:ribosomal protein S18 acetylase RimI-like enzyme
MQNPYMTWLQERFAQLRGNTTENAAPEPQEPGPPSPDQLKIRSASHADIPFLARIHYEATLPPSDQCFWDELLVGTNTTSLSFIEAMLQADASNWGNVGDCFVLEEWGSEEQGNPVAAAAGYRPYAEDYRILDLSRLDGIAHRLGWSNMVTQQFHQRYQQMFDNDPQPIFFMPQADWMIEFVAVLPEARGRGLAKVLLRAILEEGRSRGHTHAGIAVINGNEIARRTYESLGFRPYQSYYAEYFEGTFPGITKFRMALS